jgi:hypothetical protein
MAAVAIYQGYQQSAALNESAQLQKQAGAEANRVAQENASRIEAEGAEQQRRLDLQMKQEESAARAAAAASGAVYTQDEDKQDTISTVLRSQKDENVRQLDWERTATKSQADSVRKQGQYAQTMANYQAKSLKSQAKDAVINGWLGGMTTFLGADTTPGSSTVGSDIADNFGSWWSGSSAQGNGGVGGKGFGYKATTRKYGP